MNATKSDYYTFSISKLTIDSVEELNRDDTLYVVDFRATGETLTHDINSMFIYENLSQWLGTTDENKLKGMYVVNSQDIERTDMSARILVAPPGPSPSESLISRVEEMPANISRIWSGVPHPSIDERTVQLGLKNNYKYEDFLRYNDKLSQKRHLVTYLQIFLKLKTRQI